MEKEFGKLTRQQLRECYAYYHGYKSDFAEFSQLVKDRKERITAIVACAGSWGSLYEVPYSSLVINFLEFAGFLPTFIKFAKDPDPQQRILDFLARDCEPENLTKEEEHALIVVFMAIMGNMEASVTYGENITDLIRKVDEGDDEALFRAVRVDRACIQASPIAERIAVAHLMDDTAFMDKLAKAITKTKPIRPSEELDDTRFLLNLLDDAVGLKNINNATVDQLIADDLEAIAGGKTYARISKLLTEFRKKSSKK